MKSKLNLGYMNGWTYESYPIEYTECREAGHQLKLTDLNGRGTHKQYDCETCNITWRIDSGD